MTILLRAIITVFFSYIICLNSYGSSEYGASISIGYTGFAIKESNKTIYKTRGLDLGYSYFIKQWFTHLAGGIEVGHSRFYNNDITPTDRSNIKMNSTRLCLILGTYALKFKIGGQYNQYKYSDFSNNTFIVYGASLDIIKNLLIFTRLISVKSIGAYIKKKQRFNLLVGADFLGKNGGYSHKTQWSVSLAYNF